MAPRTEIALLSLALMIAGVSVAGAHVLDPSASRKATVSLDPAAALGQKEWPACGGDDDSASSLCGDGDGDDSASSLCGDGDDGDDSASSLCGDGDDDDDSASSLCGDGDDDDDSASSLCGDGDDGDDSASGDPA